ncbi:hypothetical protein GBAR_LOCUS9179 [Geodia barretti]|nr:hypothetical protein GBAR_LOCUS9179 [Geodia barretti]
MLTPPDQPDPGLLQDCYVDTSTLQWLYDPPIGVVGGQLPEHMNLSTVLVLYHPSSQQAVQKQAESPLSAQFNTFNHDYYMFTSYVLPAAQLSIASHPTGDMYPVTFKVTPSPSAMYYEYNSQTLRYAFFEMRNGASAQERVYLAPVSPSPETNNRRLICGKLVPEGTSTPDEFFTFMAFKASIQIYVPDLPTL